MRAREQGNQRSAPHRLDDHRVDRGRADTARLRADAARRPDHLGTRHRGGGGTQEGRRRGQGRRRRSSAGPTQATQPTEYTYFATFAVAIAAGEITGVNRIWAYGEELDLASVTWRLYRGTADQEPDTLISAVEGAAHAPAYRGVAYVVFERLPLAPYGNRVPQLSFEIARQTDDSPSRAGIVLIPACGESVYAMDRILIGGPNRHAGGRERDDAGRGNQSCGRLRSATGGAAGGAQSNLSPSPGSATT